jgi:Dolichyl-phosphate-mannose-protein mannosyltransferase
MQVSDPQASAAGARPQPRRGAGGRDTAGRAWARPALLVASLTLLGAALRLVIAHQSVFADELSTYWIVAHHGLREVVSIVRTDAEITPPLSFALTWLTTRIALTPELLRAPALVAGVAAIPLVYLVGARTVGRRAALVATALTALSPFMVYYSAEARGYGLMLALVLLSTLALLVAVENGATRWWALYAAASCAAVYTHYTSVFALAAQLGWLWWAHPRARRPALIANAAALVAFLPWLSGLRGDLDSPTTHILSDLQALTPGYVRTAVGHWAVGYPYATPTTTVRDLPGPVALMLLAIATAIGVGAAAVAVARGRPRRLRPGSGIVLVVALALSAPLGEVLASALGSNLFGVRNLAASWPALALCFAALLVAAGRRLGVVAAALAVAAFALGAVKMLDPDVSRPAYGAAARLIDRRAAPGDVVVDGASITPAGMPGALVPAFDRTHRLFYLGREPVRYDPFRILGPAPPTAEVLRRAVAAADGRRVFLLLPRPSARFAAASAALAPRYRRVATWTSRGIVPLMLVTYAERASRRG